MTHPWQPWGWNSDAAHKQYLRLKAIRDAQREKPKPKLVVREIPDAKRDKQKADQYPLTRRDDGR